MNPVIGSAVELTTADEVTERQVLVGQDLQIWWNSAR
jgi:hypothetical protein